MRGRKRAAATAHVLNVLAAAGLLGLVLYGFISWRQNGEGFPADMRHSTIEIRRRGWLLAGHLDPSAPPGDAGLLAVEGLAQDLAVEVRWVRWPASDLLRRLETDSLDVLAGMDASLPGAEAFGLTPPYARRGRSQLVLAVPAGENRLLGLAAAAVRSLAAPPAP